MLVLSGAHRVTTTRGTDAARRDDEKDHGHGAAGGADTIEPTSGFDNNIPTQRDYDNDPRPSAAGGASGTEPSSEYNSNVPARRDIDKDTRPSSAGGASSTKISSGCNNIIASRRDVKKDQGPSTAIDGADDTSLRDTCSNASSPQHHHAREAHKTCKPAYKLDAQRRSSARGDPSNNTASCMRIKHA